jgi:hypothetical protein
MQHRRLVMGAGVPIDGGICYPRTCWDYGLYRIINSLSSVNDYETVLMSALWCRDLLTFEAVKELDEQSECFQDIPLTLRREFLERVKWSNLDSKWFLTLLCAASMVYHIIS